MTTRDETLLLRGAWEKPTQRYDNWGICQGCAPFMKSFPEDSEERRQRFLCSVIHNILVSFRGFLNVGGCLFPDQIELSTDQHRSSIGFNWQRVPPRQVSTAQARRGSSVAVRDSSTVWCTAKTFNLLAAPPTRACRVYIKVCMPSPRDVATALQGHSIPHRARANSAGRHGHSF